MKTTIDTRAKIGFTENEVKSPGTELNSKNRIYEEDLRKAREIRYGSNSSQSSESRLSFGDIKEVNQENLSSYYY